MKPTTAIAMLSTISMMLVGCASPKLESQSYQEDECVWTDTPGDVLDRYEWTGVVSEDVHYIEADVPLFLHCRI